MNMSMPKFIIAAIALAASSAHAVECKSVEVTVEPLQFEQRKIGYVELKKTFGGGQVGLFGAVYARPYAYWKDCKVQMAFKDVVLMVAEELRGDACAWSAIMHHELTHIAIYHQAIGAAKEFVERRAPEVGIRNALNEFFDATAQAQARIDTHEEYAKARTLCGGRILELTASVR